MPLDTLTLSSPALAVMELTSEVVMPLRYKCDNMWRALDESLMPNSNELLNNGIRDNFSFK